MKERVKRALVWASRQSLLVQFEVGPSTSTIAPQGFHAEWNKLVLGIPFIVHVSLSW